MLAYYVPVNYRCIYTDEFLFYSLTFWSNKITQWYYHFVLFSFLSWLIYVSYFIFWYFFEYFAVLSLILFVLISYYISNYDPWVCESDLCWMIEGLVNTIPYTLSDKTCCKKNKCTVNLKPDYVLHHLT